jgi:hypothetical protein
MTTTSRRAVNPQIQQQILDEYALLVDFDGAGPSSIPKSVDGDNESWKSWCKRVLGTDIENVRVYVAADEVRGQTKLKSLAKAGPAAAINSLLQAQKRIVAAKVQARQTRTAAKAQRETADLQGLKKRIDASRKRLKAADDASRLTSFVDDLDARLAGDGDADPELALENLVSDHAHRLLEAARSGTPVIDLFWELLQFSSKCRREYAKSMPPPPPHGPNR